MIRLESDARDQKFVHPVSSSLGEWPAIVFGEADPPGNLERVVLNAPDQYRGRGQESASRIQAWLL